MRPKIIAALAAIIALFILAASGCGGGSTATQSSTAESLAEQAAAEVEQGNLNSATELYKQARQAYQDDGDGEGARGCLDRIQDISMIEVAYPLSEEEMRDQLAEAFPDVAETEREGWIASGELEHMVIDGEPHYYYDVVSNIRYRNVDLFQQDEQLLGHYEKGYSELVAIMDEPAGADWQPYTRPITYRGTHTLDVPREVLPSGGLLKIWFPIPVITGPQPAVRVTSISPQEYAAGPPSIDQDIGVVYMEVPLDGLREDLNITVEFEFDHYEQHFVIDPGKVGEYDTGSALYREYTASGGNILVTEDIEETAREVVGDETNPYLAAMKLNDYVVDNITYSFVPHSALWPRGVAESVYVHENRHGDCGAQSMYFSSLCRAVGIPARTTGGWQLFTGNFAGHFWAEFYLPDYGWVPVDPTAAEIVDYIPGLSDVERQDFKDFFFGNQDHLRCVVQKDVDEPLIPPATQPILITAALQQPAYNCDTMEEIPVLVLGDYWSMSAEVLSE
ncbi:MAG: transglutaminase domain-containing protein [Actinobacteria bacterium]|nr:transglutaminase domain-containing protein [Actinomycetota bacterium]